MQPHNCSSIKIKKRMLKTYALTSECQGAESAGFFSAVRSQTPWGSQGEPCPPWQASSHRPWGYWAELIDSNSVHEQVPTFQMVTCDQEMTGGSCQEQPEMGAETNYTVGPGAYPGDKLPKVLGWSPAMELGTHTHGVTGAGAQCPGLSWNEAPEILVIEGNGVPGEAGKGQ